MSMLHRNHTHTHTHTHTQIMHRKTSAAGSKAQVEALRTQAWKGIHEPTMWDKENHDLQSCPTNRPLQRHFPDSKQFPAPLQFLGHCGLLEEAQYRLGTKSDPRAIRIAKHAIRSLH